MKPPRSCPQHPFRSPTSKMTHSQTERMLWTTPPIWSIENRPSAKIRHRPVHHYRATSECVAKIAAPTDGP